MSHYRATKPSFRQRASSSIAQLAPASQDRESLTVIVETPSHVKVAPGGRQICRRRAEARLD